MCWWMEKCICPRLQCPHSGEQFQDLMFFAQSEQSCDNGSCTIFNLVHTREKPFVPSGSDAAICYRYCGPCLGDVPSIYRAHTPRLVWTCGLCPLDRIAYYESRRQCVQHIAQQHTDEEIQLNKGQEVTNNQSITKMLQKDPQNLLVHASVIETDWKKDIARGRRFHYGSDEGQRGPWISGD